MKYFFDTEFHEYTKEIEAYGFNGNNYTKYKIDTIELISIGIVAEDGREYYAICNEFDTLSAYNNDWVFNNVLMPIGNELNRKQIADKKQYKVIGNVEELKFLIDKYGKSKKQIAKEIVEFVGKDNLEFYAYYADYDWVVFCWLFGRMIDLPDNFPMYCKDLKQMLDEKIDTPLYRKVLKEDKYLTLEEAIENIKTFEGYPKQENEHNALADAKWNKKLFNFIKTL